MVRFADPRALNNVGANLFASQQPGEVDTVSRVQGGAIERSNVQAIVEMSRMIDVNRNYTSVAGMISRMDELRRSAISRLADANA
jgi:flagellar basal-body rod protein FlgF